MSCITRIFLLVLYLSLHACDGRRLIANSKHEKRLKIYNQDGQKEISSLSSVHGGHENGATSNRSKVAETSHLVVDEAKPLAMEASSLVAKKQTTTKRAHKSDAVRRSVTWRVPGNKHREEPPGFSLDYSPPKTHPPSHN